ncbi:YveK family protein [Alkalibacillus salilacus]|uniref:Capsular polysaccharide biosynthesis protein n=1 Tax=Alkalibacillus salilacus TaxID=284582 RepID=A0ABT9VHR0_9BACI|nr:Wzz/FepE/Etk N-terminal domain-containing protein [Alkalibacillus salilacus]MDQ0160442.1 capsular polysaccharide biosynthesis protein [Alkalibacillus salilacus]
MEETISLQEIWQTLKKRLKLIILITVLAILASIIATMFFMTPQYEADSQFIVAQSENNQNQQITQGDIQTNVELINTYNVIIQSPAVLTDVIDELGLDLSAGALSNRISVNNANSSQVVNVAVTGSDHEEAVNIANTTVSVFMDKVPEYMNVDNVSVLSEAVHETNPSPISPNLTLNLAIAMVLGVMIGVGVAFILEYLDTTIKTEDDIENTLGLPTMGLISTFEFDEGNEPSNQNRSRKGGPFGA